MTKTYISNMSEPNATKTSRFIISPSPDGQIYYFLWKSFCRPVLINRINLSESSGITKIIPSYTESIHEMFFAKIYWN